MKRLAITLAGLGAGLFGCDPQAAAAGGGGRGESGAVAEAVAKPVAEAVAEPVAEPVAKPVAEVLPKPGKVAMSVECTGPLTLEPARYGTPVYYRTDFGTEPDLGDRVVGLRLPVEFAGEPQDLQVRLRVGEPRPGLIEFPMEGDGAPVATVTFGRSEAVGKSARLTVSRADNVFSGTLSLELRHEGSSPQEASCTIAVTDVPFVPFVNSQVMWEGKGDKVQLSLLSSSGSSEGPDTWAVSLPDDVGGKLAFKLQGAPGLGTHKLPTDAIHASIEDNDGAKVRDATLTTTRNPYGTYDADVDAVVEVAGEAVRVRGMLRYMSTGAFRSARAVEAREALNVARGEPDGDSTRHPPK